MISGRVLISIHKFFAFAQLTGIGIMKNKAKVLLLVFGMLLSLTGCLTGCKKAKPKNTEQTAAVDEAVLAGAKSVYDLASYMTMNEDKLIYSDCRHDEDLHFYFDILNYEEYIKVNFNGRDYALLYYDFRSYGLSATGIKSVKKSYSDQSLNVEVDVRTKEVSSEGCFPSSTRCRLILKLDQDVSSVCVWGRPYTEYSGGHVFIGGKEGLVDKDLQFLISPVYDGIYELMTFEQSDCPVYYRVAKDGHNGVLDNNYNRVLSNSYGNVYYINENKFIVGTYLSDASLDEIYIVDGNENILKKTKGFLSCESDSNFYCADGQIAFCDPSYGYQWGHGVMDQDLNTVIEPVYYNVFWLDTRYKVEDHDSNVYYFNVEGQQI